MADRIMEGDVTKLSMNPVTGKVRMLKGLDYKWSREHELIIRIEEAMIFWELGKGERGETTATN